MTLRLLYISVLLSLCLQAHAQTFPIQGNAMLTPPYSPYLTDLTAPGAQRLMLTLRVNDPTLSDYTCKLRLTIEGVGITLRTRASFFPQAITLQGGGIPQTFYGEDLMEYFNPANLDFAGITRLAFDKTKRLPEGIYRFTFEIVDYNRGTVVSSKISTTAWIILNDPPLLNLPRLHTKISLLDPINIPFTWTPRHSASPNAAFTTEYIFRMVELPPGDYKNMGTAQAAANQAMLSQAPLLESVLTQSQLVYGLSEPALIPGRYYAWQVEAGDTEGRDLFKNNGKSEVFVFQFGDALGTPLNLHSQGSTATAISIRWELPEHGDMPEQYRISYQYKDKWYEAVTNNRWFTIGDLQADTRYPIKVRSEKDKQYSEYSASITLNTLDASTAFQCGQKDNDLPQQIPREPLFRLLPGDKLSLGKFSILVTEAKGSSGMFEGKGYMSIPAFNGAGIKVKFHGKVDQAYVLDGEAESIMTEGGWAANAIDVMEKIGEDRRKLEDALQQPADVPVLLTIVGEIVAVVVTPSGDIEIEKADGTKEIIKHPLDEISKEKETVVLTDEKGNSYTVSKEGTVTNNGNSTSGTVASNVHYTVSFVKDDAQQFGFDKKEHDALSRYYMHDSIQSSDYSIAWKSMATGGIDKVKVSASVSRPDFAKEAGFKSDKGAIPKLPGSTNELILTLQGGSHQEVETITAYLNKQDAEDNYIEETIGKLNLISYNKVNKTLVLVPVNETTLPLDVTSLQQDLNKIYSTAVVQWQVRTEPSLKSTYDTDNNGLEYGNSGLFSNYTPEMRTILNDYWSDHTLANDTYYLFLVPDASDKDVKGYMPRKKQAGFIFTNQLSGANLTKTIAHELAHGAFRLEHTFPELPENGNNLMDYSSTGTQLHKHQWDNIHDPVAVLGLFEEDEEGAAMSLPCLGIFDDCDDVLAILKGIKHRVDNKYEMLPVFKPNSEKNRKGKYVGLFLTVEDTDYAKIIIKNLISEDSIVDPKLYYDYHEREGENYAGGGFMFKASENSLFKVIVADEKDSTATHGQIEKLRKYLFGDIRPQGSETEETTTVCSSGFCCTKCGRDLTMTQERLRMIFPNSNIISQNGVEFANIFNTALQTGQLNNCDRQAKLFAQIDHESIGFKARVEGQNANGTDRDWPIDFILTYFNKSAGAKNHFFNQKFWDNKIYKTIITSNYYEKVDSLGTHKSESSVDYYGKYNGQDQLQYHVNVPSNFKVDTAGIYKTYIVPVNQKAQYRINMFIKAYDGANGNIKLSTDTNTQDGWTYRGRGAIQLTGRGNYQRNQQEIADNFDRVVDLINEPELVATDNEIMVYSAIAFILQNVTNIENFDTMTIDQVSALVNTGNFNSPIANVNGGSGRSTSFKKLIANADLFQCDD